MRTMRDCSELLLFFDGSSVLLDGVRFGSPLREGRRGPRTDFRDGSLHDADRLVCLPIFRLAWFMR